MPPVIATCFVDEMEHPLHLSLTADVAGISVHFDLLTEDGKVISSSREDGVEEKETLSLDFGDSCALGNDHCLLLRVTNLSGIEAKVASHVVNFPAAVVQCSQTPTGMYIQFYVRTFIAYTSMYCINALLCCMCTSRA